MINFILTIVLSYLVGSIPNSIIFCRLIKGIDIREHGSGNAGATNVYRVMGAKVALLVLLLDILKGVAAVIFISRLATGSGGLDPVYIRIIAGFCAIAGHIWTVFAKFKGGKGVGTSLGVFIALLPIPSIIALGAFIAVFSVTRVVSVGSLIAGLVLPLVTVIMRITVGAETGLVVFAMVIGALVWFTHIPNIKRILAGEEKKLQRIKT